MRSTNFYQLGRSFSLSTALLTAVPLLSAPLTAQPEIRKFAPPLIGHVTDGRLLLYSPERTDQGGASWSDTEGFFDCADVPPWDTWVCYIPSGSVEPLFKTAPPLVCWIPPALIEIATDGIEVNPMGCLAWASDIDNNFKPQLPANFLA